MNLTCELSEVVNGFWCENTVLESLVLNKIEVECCLFGVDCVPRNQNQASFWAAYVFSAFVAKSYFFNYNLCYAVSKAAILRWIFEKQWKVIIQTDAPFWFATLPTTKAVKNCSKWWFNLV